MMATLPDAARQAVSDSYAAAFSPLFMVSSGFALVGLVSALLLKPTRLPTAAAIPTVVATAEPAE